MASELVSAEYQALGEFRFQIRRFLHFSEAAARAHELEPQQHQMLLAIRVLDEPGGSTIGRLAEHLFIQPHSAVGLVDRLVERGLVERARGSDDRRQVRVRLTDEGAERLKRLTDAHRAELRETGPLLLAALAKAINSDPTRTRLQGRRFD